MRESIISDAEYWGWDRETTISSGRISKHLLRAGYLSRDRGATVPVTPGPPTFEDELLESKSMTVGLRSVLFLHENRSQKCGK